MGRVYKGEGTSRTKKRPGLNQKGNFKKTSGRERNLCWHISYTRGMRVSQPTTIKRKNGGLQTNLRGGKSIKFGSKKLKNTATFWKGNGIQRTFARKPGEGRFLQGKRS